MLFFGLAGVAVAGVLVLVLWFRLFRTLRGMEEQAHG
jgi:HAMP domain-containing protein